MSEHCSHGNRVDLCLSCIRAEVASLRAKLAAAEEAARTFKTMYHNAADDRADTEAKLAAAERERDDERARREFMQVHSRYLGWGLVGPNKEVGVACYDEGYYQNDRYVVLYPNGGECSDEDKRACEGVVIDLARKAAPTGERKVGWLHALLAERDAAQAAASTAMTMLAASEAALKEARGLAAFACGHPWDESALSANGGSGCRFCGLEGRIAALEAGLWEAAALYCKHLHGHKCISDNCAKFRALLAPPSGEGREEKDNG